MPLVSVIMPSYNHELYISESIESVLEQTLKDFELIIIDDGSCDESLKVIEKYEKLDGRIRKIIHQENRGIPRTLNEGIKNSKGEYVAFIASDDVWINEKLEKQTEILKKNENVVCWSDQIIIDSHSNPTDEICSEKYKNSTSNGYVFEEVVNSWIAGSSLMVKRANLKNIEFNEDLKYLNDTKFFVDLAYNYNFYFMEDILSKYRLHGYNASYGEIKDIIGWYNDSLLLCKYIINEYGDELSVKALKNLFMKTCITPLLIGINNDLFNKFNLIYPIITPLTLFFLTIRCRSIKTIKRIFDD